MGSRNRNTTTKIRDEKVILNPKGKSEKRKSPSIAFQTVYLGLSLAGVVSLLVYFLVFKEKEQFETFVPVTNKVKRSFLEVQCSKDYQLEQFEECKPKKCGRVVMDNLINEDDAKHLLMIAKKGLSLGGSSGGASILDLHSGALSKDDSFIDLYRFIKSEEIDLLSQNDFNVYKKVKDQIHQAISQEFNIPLNKLYLTKPTFFSRMNMTPPTTIHDEYWHAHVDKETYGSFHYTSLLYLSTYETDFTGGRFIFIDKNSNKTVEPKLGRVSFFTSGSENLHRVERLKTGVRFAITVSFTCDPKQAIADPAYK